ncbi:RNA-guided endonuclease InsQ/TnpB family protein [Vibrio breoganii]|uniref:RNA-guided endonuclease InsQ/TnpB family protein n=1 Tax=Vibrio breoganii TaxID=553239 RepID=UPI000C85B46D|nr:RNA-guided endonuclease TnpB family protein [Vibrio breoganii]PMJ49624.1 transposase [Vibrio breoganii]PMK60141.1 transposase [Vibrio breoganii]PMO25695.1 transposase [Vibrio breoganii]PMO26335.1 transposase [Vibrio breoganii]PMO60286.1 transposase [Vibrio breoganii]
MKTLRYNYRLKPTAAQEATLIEFGSYARGLWNFLLSENKRQYEVDESFVFYNEMASKIKEIKKLPEFAWVKAFDSGAAQQVARDLDAALRKGVSKTDRQRFPRFKVSYRIKKQHNDSYRAVNNSNCIRVEKGTITLPKVGAVPIVLHRNLVSKIKIATVQYRHGHWEVSLTQEVVCDEAKRVLKSIAGYDINSKQTVVGSTGLTIDNPKYLKQERVKLTRLQRQLSMKKKGSGRWKKAKARLNKLHGAIARKRMDFAHKTAHRIANESDIVVFEDLNVAGMQKFNGKMVADNIMGLISNLTQYKVELRGGVHHEIGRFERTTGVCSSCGQHHKLTLKERHFTCTNCGLFSDRDHSSAIAVERKGEFDLMANGTVVRVTSPNTQQKSGVKTKVFALAKLSSGAEEIDKVAA